MASTALNSNGRSALSRLIPVVISAVLIGTLLILFALKASAPQEPPRTTATPLAGPVVLSGNLDIPFYVWNWEEHHYKKDAPVIFAKPGVPSIFAAYVTSDGKLVREAEGAFEVVKSAGGMINDREFREGEKFLVRIGNDPDNKNFFTIPLTLFPGTHLFDLKFGSDTWRVSFQTVSLVANSVMYNPPATTSGLEEALQSNPDVKVALASLDVVGPEKCRSKQVQSTGFYMLAYNGGVITQGDWVPEGKWVWLLECDITIDGKTEAKLIPINPDCLNPQFGRPVTPPAQPVPSATLPPMPTATPRPAPTVPTITPTPVPTETRTPGPVVQFGPVPEGPTWTPMPRKEVIAQATETPGLLVVTTTPQPTSVPQLTPSPTTPVPATVTPMPATPTFTFVLATQAPSTVTPGPSPTLCPCPTPSRFVPTPTEPAATNTPVRTPNPTHTSVPITTAIRPTSTMVPWPVAPTNTPGPLSTAGPQATNTPFF